MENDGVHLTSRFNEKYSILTRRIVRLLSENSRMSVLEMSKELGISRRTIKDKLEKAEEELGLRYTLELNENVVHMDHPHLILVKFFGKPNYDDIKRILLKTYVPQSVVLMKGDYDMMIYANAVSSSDYVHWDWTTRVQLSKYKIFWQSSDVAHMQLGFFPVRNELIDRLDIPQKSKEMLKLLNTDARMQFREISERLGMHFNTVAYNFNKLVEMGYIKKFTLVMKPPKDVSMVSLFGKYTLADNFEVEASKMRREVTLVDDPYAILSRIFLSSQLIGSYDYFSFGAFDNIETAKAMDVNYYRRNFKRHGVKMVSAEYKGMLFGDLPLRSLDPAKVHNSIKWVAPD
jgi:DNA-binding Lrp family transcriptional regulator